MQKYVKNEKRYRLINFICLLALYKKLIGTGRVLSTRILRYVKVCVQTCLIYLINDLGLRTDTIKKLTRRPERIYMPIVSCISSELF